jgi:hypothetical protein
MNNETIKSASITESDRKLMIRVMKYAHSIVDTLFQDYSDYDLTNPDSLMSIAQGEYLGIVIEEAPDFDDVTKLIESEGDYETE